MLLAMADPLSAVIRSSRAQYIPISTGRDAPIVRPWCLFAGIDACDLARIPV